MPIITKSQLKKIGEEHYRKHPEDNELDEDYEYLNPDNGEYRDNPDMAFGGVSTQEPVNGTMAKTKSITGDEYQNDMANNNYWWSRAVGGRNLNCAFVTNKKHLKEEVEKRYAQSKLSKYI
jgi:hypothetical protein